MRNPKWSTDELIVTLDFYFKHTPSIPDKKSNEINDLSKLLNNLGQNVGVSGNEKFRNQNGVYMKLMNFRSLDPTFPGGLANNSKGDKNIWDEFSKKKDQLSKSSQGIKSHINNNEIKKVEINFDEEEGVEGTILTKLHKYRERNTKLVNRKKTQVFHEKGCLRCEICDFEFIKFYGKRSLSNKGDEFIECHHNIPLSELKTGNKTRLSDLSLLCSNCHRMIHRKKPWLTVSKLKKIVHSND